MKEMFPSYWFRLVDIIPLYGLFSSEYLRKGIGPDEAIKGTFNTAGLIFYNAAFFTRILPSALEKICQ